MLKCVSSWVTPISQQRGKSAGRTEIYLHFKQILYLSWHMHFLHINAAGEFRRERRTLGIVVRLKFTFPHEQQRAGERGCPVNCCAWTEEKLDRTAGIPHWAEVPGPSAPRGQRASRCEGRLCSSKGLPRAPREGSVEAQKRSGQGHFRLRFCSSVAVLGKQERFCVPQWAGSYASQPPATSTAPELSRDSSVCAKAAHSLSARDGFTGSSPQNWVKDSRELPRYSDAQGIAH